MRGLTLVELMFAMAILLIGAMGLSAMYLNSARLGDLNAQQQMASKEILAQMAQIRAISKTGFGGEADFNGVVAYLEQAVNRQFTVSGLTPVANEATTGQIVMYLNEASVPVELGADSATAVEVDGRFFGVLQIDSDPGTITNHTGAVANGTVGEIQLIPIELSVTWQSQTGNVTMRRYMSIARMDAMRP